MMKRRTWLSVALTIVLVMAAATALAGDTYEGFPVVKVLVNGQLLQSDVPPINFKGRTLLPVRAVAEAVGAQVGWEAATSTVTLMTTEGAQAARVAELETQNQQLTARVASLQAELADTRAASAPAPQPTTQSQVGYSRSNPAPIGTTLRIARSSLGENATFDVTLRETLRGAAAWEQIRKANSMNSQPKVGEEYLLAKIAITLVSADDQNAKQDVSPVHFTVVSAQGRDYDRFVMAVAPDPDLRTSLYPGASHEGWAVYTVSIGDMAPLLTYGRDYQGRGGIWFKTAK